MMVPGMLILRCILDVSSTVIRLMLGQSGSWVASRQRRFLRPQKLLLSWIASLDLGSLDDITA